MNRGRRYEEPKLNMKKVFAVIIAIIVIIMFIFIVKGMLTKDKDQSKITSNDYFVSFQNNKWGVIDSKGETVIDPSYGEMIVIPNSKNDVFICTYDVNYNTGDYKTKVLNKKNQEIFTNYERVEAIANKDENNNLWYEDNVLRVKKDGKYGIINLSGKELTSIEYDEIVAMDGIKNTLKVKKDGKYGVMDNEGKELILTQYKDVINLGEDNKAGFIVQADDGKYGVVDYSGISIIKTKYDGISKVYGNDYYVVKQEGKEILVKKDETQVLTSGFNEIKAILNNTDNGIIYTNNKNLYGVMKITGEVVIDPTYEELKETKTGIFIAKKSGKYGIIDLEKTNKTEFKYTSINYDDKADLYIAEDANYNNEIIDNNFEVKLTGILTDIDDEKGYIKIRQGEDYKYYNLRFEEKYEKDIFSTHTLYLSKQDNKYGFVDKDGKVVVDYIYDDATEQNAYGYAAVKKDGKWGSINQKGSIVQEPTYDLDEYLKIDFIGRWHYGKDINMNYYNQL